MIFWSAVRVWWHCLIRTFFFPAHRTCWKYEPPKGITSIRVYCDCGYLDLLDDGWPPKFIRNTS